MIALLAIVTGAALIALIPLAAQSWCQHMQEREL